MGDARRDKTKCRSGRHDWLPENIIVNARGWQQCRLCKRESTRKTVRARRALAKTMTEAELLDRVDLDHYYWPRVDKQEDCWIWRGCKDGEGYGYVSVLSRPVSAHRIAYRLECGDIPKGFEVCHRCDTPLCVNPDHLFVATHEQNMRDMREKGRWPGFPKRRSAI